MISNLDKPGVRVVGIPEIEQLTLEGAALRFPVEVSNPYGLPMPVSQLDFALSGKGGTFLDGKQSVQGTVPAKGVKVFPTTVHVTFANMLGFLQDVRPGDVVPYKAAFGFSVDAPGVGPLRLPLETQGELPVPAAPGISVAGIDWQNPSLTNIGGVLRLAIANNNSFEMDLANMALNLGLGGSKVLSTGIEDAVHLDAKKGKEVRIPISLSPLSLGTGVLSLIRGSDAAYTVDGKFDAFTPFGAMVMPFTGAGRTPQSH